MGELTDATFEAAEERGRLVFATEPHARAVRYDRTSGMTVVDLYNGCTFAFPTRRLQGLTQASDDDLAAVEISGAGFGLHWQALDADFTIGGLMAGRFGSGAYMEHERERLRALIADASTDPRPHAA